MDEKQLLIKQFQHFNIEIYGTYEDPLFKAKDIGDLLCIKDIKSTLRDFDKDEVHTMHLIDNLGRRQDTNMLTEDGLYRLLMISRKPIAKQFQKWVFKIIKEIRINSNKQLHENNQHLQKQLEYYKEKTFEQVHLDQTIYIMSTDKDNVFKVGKTDKPNSKIRKGQLQTACVEDISILYEFKTSNSKLLEDLIHYTLHKYRSNSGREHFFCNLDFIKMIINICGKFINTMGSIYQSIPKDELIKHLEINIPIIQTIQTQHIKHKTKKKKTKSTFFIEECETDDFTFLELLHKPPLIQEIVP